MPALALIRGDSYVYRQEVNMYEDEGSSRDMEDFAEEELPAKEEVEGASTRLKAAVRAAYRGESVEECIEMIRGLSSEELNMKLDDKCQRSFLHYIAASGREDVFEVAMNLGCNHLVEDSKGYTPGAALRRVIKLRGELAKEEQRGNAADVVTNGLSVAYEYAAKGDFYGTSAAMSMVPRDKVDTGVDDVSGGTALQCAVGQNVNNDIIEALMLSGCLIGAVDSNGNNSLHSAVMTGNPEAIKFLRDQATREELNAQNERGDTAAHIAARSKNCKAVTKAIINKLSDISIRNKDGETIFHEAAQRQNGQDIIDLVERAENTFKGVEGGQERLVRSVMSSDAKGRTVLGYAVSRNLPEVNKLLGSLLDMTKKTLGTEAANEVITDCLSSSDRSTGYTMLHMACSGSAPGIRMLALNIIEEAKQCGGEREIFGAIDSQGRTPLHFAATRAHADVFKKLLEGSQIDGIANQPTDNGECVVHYVMGEGGKAKHRKAKLAALVECAHMTQMNVASPSTGNTPLVQAYKQGEKDIREILMRSNDLDMDARSRDGTTIIHLAAADGKVKFLNRCLEKRLERHAGNQWAFIPSATFEDSPAVYAMKKGNGKIKPEVLGALLPYEDVERLSLKSIELNGEKVLRHLLDSKLIGVDDKLPRGIEAGNEPTTMVHTALRQGKVKLAEELVARGAKFDGIVAESAITEGIRGGCFKGSSGARILKRLIDQGAEVNVPEGSSHTSPLMAAMETRYSIAERLVRAGKSPNRKAVQILLDNGADPNFRDPRGDTAMHAAAASGDIELAKQLMRHGARPENANVEGYTAMHIAASSGNLEMIGVIVKHHPEALMHRTASTHSTIFHEAIRSTLVNDKQVLRMLQIAEKGLSAEQFKNLINAQDIKGNTLMHMAASKGSRKLVNYLMQHGASLSMANIKGNTATNLVKDARFISKGLFKKQSLWEEMKSREIRPEQGFAPYVPREIETTEYGTVPVENFVADDVATIAKWVSEHYAGKGSGLSTPAISTESLSNASFVSEPDGADRSAMQEAMQGMNASMPDLDIRTARSQRSGSVDSEWDSEFSSEEDLETHSWPEDFAEEELPAKEEVEGASTRLKAAVRAAYRGESADIYAEAGGELYDEVGNQLPVPPTPDYAEEDIYAEAGGELYDEVGNQLPVPPTPDYAEEDIYAEAGGELYDEVGNQLPVPPAPDYAKEDIYAETGDELYDEVGSQPPIPPTPDYKQNRDVHSCAHGGIAPVSSESTTQSADIGKRGGIKAFFAGIFKLFSAKTSSVEQGVGEDLYNDEGIYYETGGEADNLYSIAAPSSKKAPDLPPRNNLGVAAERTAKRDPSHEYRNSLSGGSGNIGKEHSMEKATGSSSGVGMGSYGDVGFSGVVLNRPAVGKRHAGLSGSESVGSLSSGISSSSIASASRRAWKAVKRAMPSISFPNIRFRYSFWGLVAISLHGIIDLGESAVGGIRNLIKKIRGEKQQSSAEGTYQSAPTISVKVDNIGKSDLSDEQFRDGPITTQYATVGHPGVPQQRSDEVTDIYAQVDKRRNTAPEVESSGKNLRPAGSKVKKGNDGAKSQKWETLNSPFDDLMQHVERESDEISSELEALKDTRTRHAAGTPERAVGHSASLQDVKGHSGSSTFSKRMSTSEPDVADLYAEVVKAPESPFKTSSTKRKRGSISSVSDPHSVEEPIYANTSSPAKGPRKAPPKPPRKRSADLQAQDLGLSASSNGLSISAQDAAAGYVDMHEPKAAAARSRKSSARASNSNIPAVEVSSPEGESIYANLSSPIAKDYGVAPLKPQRARRASEQSVSDEQGVGSGSRRPSVSSITYSGYTGMSALKAPPVPERGARGIGGKTESEAIDYDSEFIHSRGHDEICVDDDRITPQLPTRGASLQNDVAEYGHSEQDVDINDAGVPPMKPTRGASLQGDIDGNQWGDEGVNAEGLMRGRSFLAQLQEGKKKLRSVSPSSEGEISASSHVSQEMNARGQFFAEFQSKLRGRKKQLKHVDVQEEAEKHTADRVQDMSPEERELAARSALFDDLQGQLQEGKKKLKYLDPSEQRTQQKTLSFSGELKQAVKDRKLRHVEPPVEHRSVSSHEDSEFFKELVSKVQNREEKLRVKPYVSEKYVKSSEGRLDPINESAGEDFPEPPELSKWDADEQEHGEQSTSSVLLQEFEKLASDFAGQGHDDMVIDGQLNDDQPTKDSHSQRVSASKRGSSNSGIVR
ncbi:ankyrin repeat-containing protein [Anaplasma platys]|uniref:Ankyrin repeat-containing protein n=1 Tax=Anaplasma platys TaxID=949 RepID=A0A858PYE8_9RICK|nr:ankyrin repeat domain-containing protein [Anaplasma platys]QJC27636.1 ankyrin repeat-containing protein [Anaplasma platys]